MQVQLDRPAKGGGKVDAQPLIGQVCVGVHDAAENGLWSASRQDADYSGHKQGVNA